MHASPPRTHQAAGQHQALENPLRGGGEAAAGIQGILIMSRLPALEAVGVRPEATVLSYASGAGYTGWTDVAERYGAPCFYPYPPRELALALARPRGGAHGAAPRRDVPSVTLRSGDVVAPEGRRCWDGRREYLGAEGRAGPGLYKP
ncbi:hypothetical protein GSI_09803 [Ganoderma sinense ZZ0214-1]|uniref:Uncharacterized protein n=1 Tax=Ganoderma sinense ZZ0214-1 TaxID=1077348 RepID=A0A2G8S2S3_9APHY|nr:hypothetical protein GSI_09803 [Ganoderma sinense ZZ0214-1]